MAKDKKRVPLGETTTLRGGLPGLDALRAALPASASASGVTPASAATPPPAPRTIWSRASKVVVRRERKGHGGKTATRIEGLAGSARELDDARRELQRALGCGATVDGGDVVLQGAPGDRLVAFLGARGVRKVVVGS